MHDENKKIGKEIVVKGNLLVEAQYELTLPQQKIIALIISKIKKSDKEMLTYEFDIKEVLNTLSLGPKNEKFFLKTLREFKGKDIIIREKNSKKMLHSSWISSYSINAKGDKVKFSLDEQLAPFLLSLETNFTMYSLGNILNIKSKYSIRFYELLKKEIYRGYKRYSIEKLREMLSIKEGQYKVYKDFRKRIIKHSIKEINEKTDIFVTHEEIKKDKKVLEIKFIIKKKETLYLENKIENPFLDKILNIGVEKEKALEIIENKNYTEKMIEKALDMLETRKKDEKKKKLRSEAGFFITTLEKDFVSIEIEKDKKKEESLITQNKKKLKIAREARIKELKGLFIERKTKLENKRFNAYREGFSSLDFKEELNKVWNSKEFQEAHSEVVRMGRGAITADYSIRSFITSSRFELTQDQIDEIIQELTQDPEIQEILKAIE